MVTCKRKLQKEQKLKANISKKLDPGSRTSSALEANQFANQFGSRGKPVREPVWELVKERAKKPVILLYIIIIFNNRQVY